MNAPNTRTPVLDEAWRRNLRGELAGELEGPRRPDWWTGCTPAAAPGRRPDGSLTSLPLPDLAACSRAEVLAYFDNGWTLTEALFAGLRGEEAFYRPPAHRLRHPMCEKQLPSPFVRPYFRTCQTTQFL